MLKRFVVMVTILLVFGSVAVTAEQHDELPSKQQDNNKANKKSEEILSAAVQRKIQSEMDQMEEEIKGYQDENFRALDGRMHELASNVRMQVILASLGSMLVGGAAVGLVTMRSFRRHSMRAIRDQMDEQEMRQTGYGESFDETQESEWYPEEPKNTVGREYGQSQASQMTRMNEWQTQPARDGSWEAPIEAEREYSQKPGGYFEDEDYYEDEYEEPEGNMRGGDTRPGGY